MNALKISTLLILFLPLMMEGQILSSNRSVDWTLAGLHDTNTIGFTYFDVTQEGVVPDGLTSANPIIDSLLQLNVSVGIHLYFPAGTYFFDEGITLPSHCLISGDGAASTHFIFNLGGSGHAIQSSGTLITYDTCSFQYSGIKDANYIVVSDASIFASGDWVRIMQEDSDWVTSSWALNSVGQIIKIESIYGDTLFLASPLRLDFPLSRKPKVIRINMKRNMGIQCLSIERMDNTAPEQASNIHFNYAENCWISGVVSNKTTFGHVTFTGVSNSLIERCYFYDAFEYGEGGRGYGVVLHFTSNECLVENNIFRHLRHSVLLQAGSNGNVISFNYSTDPYWTNSNPLLPANSAGELVLHGNYVYANLFEHNVVQNIVIDNSHGANGPFNTFLRNRAELYGFFFSDHTSPSQNIIGNEIPNNSFPYNMVNYNIAGSDQFTYGNNNKGTVSPAGTENVTDTSYYYIGKPHFLPDYQWGKIGLPNVMNSGSIPALERFVMQQYFAGVCGYEDLHTGLIDPPTIGWNLYPNPATDLMIIESADKILRIEIMHLNGQVLYQSNLNMPIDISWLKHGIYFVKVYGEQGSFVKKLIKAGG